MYFRHALILLVLAAPGLWLAGQSGWAAEGADPADKEPAFHLMGVKNCKLCHNKEATGKQYEVWKGGPHANAFASLASDQSVAKAKELGLKKHPQEEPECLRCHVTAFAVMGDLANQKITLEEGVSCESCHGPGSGYKSKKTMEGLTAGTIDPASVGLIVPDEKTCLTCHNPENPFHKEFKYAEMVKKIAHPIPAAK